MGIKHKHDVITLHLRRVIGSFVENEFDGTKAAAERVCCHLLYLQEGYDGSLMPGSFSADEEEGSRDQNI